MTTVLDGHEGKAIYPEEGSHHIAWANALTDDGELDMETALANAALIAAAPAMYELLEHWLHEAHRSMRGHFSRWIRSGLNRESLLCSKETQKAIEMIRQTKRLLKQINGDKING